MRHVAILAATLLVVLAVAPRAAAWTPPAELPGLDGTAAVAVDEDATATVASGGTLPRVAERAPRGPFGGPLALAPLAPGPPRGADVAAAGHGALAVTWQDGYGRIMAVARDPGGPVLPPVRLSPADGRGVDGPQIAVDARGGALATWLGELDRGGRGPVYAAYRPPGGAFGAPVRVTRSAATYPPALAMNAAGRAVIAWRRGTRTEAVSVRRGSFGRVSVLGRAQLDGRPVVAVGRDGSAVIAWSEQRTRRPLRRIVAVWRARHGSFGTPHTLRASPPGWTASTPAVAAGRRGETVVAWSEGRGLRRRIVAVRGRRGTRSTARPLERETPGTLVVTVRRRGRVTVAWDQPRSCATPDVLAATARRHGRFGPPRRVAAPQPSAVPVPGAAPAIATGGGVTVLVWTIPSDGIAPARVHWAALDP
jgi:hypothetical protein